MDRRRYKCEYNIKIDLTLIDRTGQRGLETPGSGLE